MKFGGGVAVIGAGIRAAHGKGWRTLATGAQKQAIPIDEPTSPQETRARRLMSRPALMATLATKDLLADLSNVLDGAQKRALGLFVGVGSSCGDMHELRAMLQASIHEGVFDLARFGDEGLRACNPLYAFQLMNNFTMCHPAIVHELTGPNACLFSRGAGTVFALVEAVASVREGLCEHALVGGADSCLHPVTLFEMQAHPYQVDDPGEGAALIAVAAENVSSALAYIENVWIVQASQPLQDLVFDIGHTDAIVSFGRGERLNTLVASMLQACDKAPKQHFLGHVFGETLAAGPAIGWCVALDLIVTGDAQRVAAVGASVDGDVYCTTFAKAPTP